jgi:hypothetical protein
MLTVRPRPVQARSNTGLHSYVIGDAQSDYGGSLSLHTLECTASPCRPLMSPAARVDIHNWEGPPGILQNTAARTPNGPAGHPFLTDTEFITQAEFAGQLVWFTRSVKNSTEQSLSAVRVTSFVPKEPFGVAATDIKGTGTASAFLPALSLRSAGTGLITYNVSSSSEYPRIHARPILGGAIGAPRTLKVGSGPKRETSKWGDYAAVTPDYVTNNMWSFHPYGSSSGPNGVGLWVSEVAL